MSRVIFSCFCNFSNNIIELLKYYFQNYPPQILFRIAFFNKNIHSLYTVKIFLFFYDQRLKSGKYFSESMIFSEQFSEFTNRFLSILYGFESASYANRGYYRQIRV